MIYTWLKNYEEFKNIIQFAIDYKSYQINMNFIFLRGTGHIICVGGERACILVLACYEHTSFGVRWLARTYAAV